MESGYQRLVRNDEPRGILRELGLGALVLVFVIFGYLLLPDFPEDSMTVGVAAAPPAEFEGLPFARGE